MLLIAVPLRRGRYKTKQKAAILFISKEDGGFVFSIFTVFAGAISVSSCRMIRRQRQRAYWMKY
jgi:hypothetical protein